MRIFFDLWGVLLDAEAMQRAYGGSLARLLQGRFGGEEARWLEAYNGAWTEYVRSVDRMDGRVQAWAATADQLDARFVLGILERAGIGWRPADAVALAKDVEIEAMSTVNARFPDARAAVERLRQAGHEVYVVTQATSSNARGALMGAELLDLLQGLYTGTSQDAPKSERRYWATIRSGLPSPEAPCVLVDDRADYLRAAASEEFMCLLLDREGIYEAETLPPFVRAKLRHLAALPPYVEALTSGRQPDGLD